MNSTTAIFDRVKNRFRDIILNENEALEDVLSHFRTYNILGYNEIEVFKLDERSFNPPIIEWISKTLLIDDNNPFSYIIMDALFLVLFEYDTALALIVYDSARM